MPPADFSYDEETAAIRGLLQERCGLCRSGEVRYTEITATEVTQYFHRSGPCEFQSQLTQQQINRRVKLIFHSQATSLFRILGESL